MKTKMITVTQEDIDLGERESYCKCPVARAVRRAFGARKNRRITVRQEAILIGGDRDERLWAALTPGSVQDFLDRFDRGLTVKPFSTTILFQ